MIEAIIKKINEDQSGLEASEKISKLKVAKERIEEIKEEIDRLQQEIAELGKSQTFLKRLTNRAEYHAREDRIKGEKDTLTELQQQLEELQQGIASIDITSDDNDFANKYNQRKHLIDLFDAHKYEELTDKIMEYFDYDFHKFIDYCQENGIVMDFTNDLLISKIPNIDELLLALEDEIKSMDEPGEGQRRTDELYHRRVKCLAELKASLSSNNLEAANENLINFFHDPLSQFEKIESFISEHKIKVNWTAEDVFLDSLFCARKPTPTPIFERVIEKYNKNIAIKNLDEMRMKVIESLDDMCMIRKTSDIPTDDILLPITQKYKKSYPLSVTVNGKNYEIKLELPKGHPTIHWTINREVGPHDNAPDGWTDNLITIIQPLSEKIYSQFSGLNPVDAFVLGSVQLEDYYVICSDRATLDKIKEKNQKATIFVLPRERKNRAADNLACLLGYYKCPYKTRNGGTLGNYSDYYSKELLKKYPKLADEKTRDLATSTPEHSMRERIKEFIVNDAIVEYILNNFTEELNLEELIKELFSHPECRCHLITLDFVDKKLHELLPEEYVAKGIVFETLSSCAKTLNPDIIFDNIIQGIEINDSNIRQLSAIKALVISLVNSVAKNDISLLTQRLYALKRLATSKAIYKPYDKQINLPANYYDFSALEQLISSVIEAEYTRGQYNEGTIFNNIIATIDSPELTDEQKKSIHPQISLRDNKTSPEFLELLNRIEQSGDNVDEFLFEMFGDLSSAASDYIYNYRRSHEISELYPLIALYKLHLEETKHKSK